jgi:hypothetical protein
MHHPDPFFNRSIIAKSEAMPTARLTPTITFAESAEGMKKRSIYSLEVKK